VSNKSVDIEGLHVRPVPAELFETSMCTHCRQNAARWEFAEGAHPAHAFACSFCFLYEAPKLKGQRLQIEFLIEAVEKKIVSVFARDKTGRLCVANDADRIVFAIVMTQRFMKSRALSGGLEGGF
jgi:hypothetical protein